MRCQLTWVFSCLVLLSAVPGAVLPSPVVAQQSGTSGQFDSCFEYYQYGNISVNLTATQPAYTPGETTEVRGTIENHNSFPLRDVILYAHVRRINSTDTFEVGGHYMIDRFPLVKDLNFLPKEKKSVTANIPIKASYPTGSYKIEYFLLSKYGFHYAGRPFLEEDIAGSSLFDVQQAPDPSVFLDLSALTLNGDTKHIRDAITVYPPEEMTFRWNIIDTRSEKTEIPVSISYYSFEDTFETNRITKTDLLLAPGEVTFTDTFVPPHTGAFVAVATLTDPFASTMRYRFGIQGTTSHELRINDMGISSFPATGSARAHVCMHSPAPELTPETLVELQVLDSDKQVITEQQQRKQFSGEILAMSLPLNEVKTPYDFWVKTKISWNADDGPKEKMIETHYTCDIFGKSYGTVEMEYAASRDALSLRAKTVCGDADGSHGFVESVRITKSDGTLVKEFYNQSVPQDISLSDIAAGTYIAELRSGEEAKRLTFSLPRVRVLSKLSSATGILVILSGVCLIVLLLLWRIYLRRRNI